MNFLFPIIFLFVALATGGTHPNQVCCFSDVSNKNTGPCTKDQYNAHRDVINGFLNGANCQKRSCGSVRLNRNRAWFYAEQYTCTQGLAGGAPGKQLPECYLQCIPVDQSGPCPERSGAYCYVCFDVALTTLDGNETRLLQPCYISKYILVW
ncbi:hypothetical protein HDK77DRAFT_446268 [Phyllosticta capitalensis]